MMKALILLPLLTIFLISCSGNGENESNDDTGEVAASEDVTIQLNDFHYKYSGMIDDQYEIEMYIHANGDSVKGYYIYTKYGVHIPLEGILNKENNTINLQEYGNLNKPVVTGEFAGAFYNDYGILGTWSDPEGNKEMSFVLNKEKELFTWYTLDVPFHPYYVNQTYSWEGDSEPVDFTNLDIEGMEYEEGVVSQIELYPDSSGYNIDLGEDVFVMRGVFFEYELLAQEGETFIVSTYECGGGTGIFSDIRVLKVEGNLIELVDDFAAGDRCNGGLMDYSYGKGVVNYSVNITPEDLLIIGGGENSEDYDIELEWCAICCVGTANYEYSLSTSTSELVSITVETEYFGSYDSYPEGTQCFFSRIKEYVNASSSEIPINKFEILIQGILESCMIPVG